MVFQIKQYCTYVLASKTNGVLYVGFTSDIVKRMYQHVNGEYDGFTRKYFIKHLVYYEYYEDPDEGIRREKCIKRWKRKWKIELIEKYNSGWKDLFEDGEVIPLPQKA